MQYKGANPSLADSFVEMDDDSKEARRQRKKKIFDDYLSPKDFERPRRKIPVESGVRRLLHQRGTAGVKRLQTSGFKLLPMPKRRRLNPAVKSSEEVRNCLSEVFRNPNQRNEHVFGNE